MRLPRRLGTLVDWITAGLVETGTSWARGVVSVPARVRTPQLGLLSLCPILSVGAIMASVAPVRSIAQIISLLLKDR